MCCDKEKANSLAPFLKRIRSLGRVLKELMKYGSVVIDDQSFETQRNLKTDSAGSFESISKVRSRGIDDDGFEDDGDCFHLLFVLIFSVFSFGCSISAQKP